MPAQDRLSNGRVLISLSLTHTHTHTLSLSLSLSLSAYLSGPLRLCGKKAQDHMKRRDAEDR